MKVQKGIIVSVAGLGLSVGIWAALVAPTAKEAPKFAAPAPAAELQQKAPEDVEPAGGGSTKRSNSSSVESASGQELPVGDDAPQVLGSRASQPGESKAKNPEDRPGSKKLKDPRDKFCPPAAGYGDKPKKDCIGHY